MLQYTSNESLTSSHFFITTIQDNICILDFKKIDQEDVDFNDDFLQENIMEMVVVKHGIYPENYCKELAHTIKGLFDEFMNSKDDLIIYVSVEEESLKHKLIRRFVLEDTNDDFYVFSFKAAGNALIFFVNKEKTDVFEAYIRLSNYFEKEYGIEFAPSL